MTVIDASTLAKYLLREENWEEVEEYLSKTVYSIDHVIKEIANAIWRHSIIRGYISKEMAFTIYRHFLKLIDAGVIIIESQEKYIDQAFKIALENNITVYDALYISQALKYGKLLTSDYEQASIARKLGVETIFIS
ncbi:MAG: type II toxin-antitoxin system VapC family toxin [Sulfolobales archaeon]